MQPGFVGTAPKETASLAAESVSALFFARFAYYKAPGHIAFVSEMPTTSTQKVRKSDFGALVERPDWHPNCFDLRARKQRRKAAPGR